MVTVRAAGTETLKLLRIQKWALLAGPPGSWHSWHITIIRVALYTLVS